MSVFASVMATAEVNVVSRLLIEATGVRSVQVWYLTRPRLGNGVRWSTPAASWSYFPQVNRWYSSTRKQAIVQAMREAQALVALIEAKET